MDTLILVATFLKLQVTSFYCLHWIRDQMTCLENILELLQENGQALLVFLASNPIFLMYERMAQKDAWKEYMVVSQYIDPASRNTIVLVIVKRMSHYVSGQIYDVIRSIFF